MHSYTYQNRDGVRRTVHPETKDKFTVHTEQDLTEILEGIKRDRDLHPTRSANKHLARVPISIYEQSVRENWDDADWKKWLNDPDNAAFRVWQGRV